MHIHVHQHFKTIPAVIIIIIIILYLTTCHPGAESSFKRERETNYK